MCAWFSNFFGPLCPRSVAAVTLGGDPDNPIHHAVDFSSMSDAELAHILGHISVEPFE
jgi:hypothetical protein